MVGVVDVLKTIVADIEAETYTVGEHQVRLASKSGVMPPSAFSLSLAHNLPTTPQHNVLDLGTGSGILGIILAQQGWKRVIATDINYQAIQLARLNAHLNCVSERLVFLVCDMFPPFDQQKFDAIVCNPPSGPMPDPPSGLEALFYYGGPEGRDFLEPLITQAPNYLKSKGLLVFTNASLANVGRTKTLLAEIGFHYIVTTGNPVPLGAHNLKNLSWLEALAQQGKCEFFANGGQLFMIPYVFQAVLKS